MNAVNLKGNPFYLKDEDIRWVNDTLASMTLKEKVGQLFCPIGMSPKFEDYKMMLEQIAPGGIMFRAGPSRDVQAMHRFLQENSRIPMLIAANLEAGGNGTAVDGTCFGPSLQVAATDDIETAYKLGLISGTEGRAVGCNWAFAPVIDIDYNFFNPITNTRTFGSDPDCVLKMGKAYMKGAQDAGLAVSIKHWPGDGVDGRDQHLVTSINSLSVEDWDRTYGKIYKELIDNGARTVMAAHIMLPEYSRKLVPGIKDADIMPATLAPEILNGLLRKQLGFNGLIVTDASVMAGFTVMMERRKAVPYSIAAGNDIFLFNKSIPEDFAYMMDGIKEGVITQDRLEEAVLRILALKASLGLHEQQQAGTLVPDESALEILGCPEHIAAAEKCADDSVTLVKDTQNLLPIDSGQHKRVILFPLGDEPGFFSDKNSTGKHQVFKELLEAEGFEVTVFDKENIDIRQIMGSVEDYLEKFDIAIYFANIATASNQTTTRISWAFPMGADIPWFNEEKSLPTLFISFANPYHLYDLPRVKTFINAYSANSIVLKAVIEKIMGRSTFKGTHPVDPFCGLWDAKL